jgi:hypothetical protein
MCKNVFLRRVETHVLRTAAVWSALATGQMNTAVPPRGQKALSLVKLRSNQSAPHQKVQAL